MSSEQQVNENSILQNPKNFSCFFFIRQMDISRNDISLQPESNAEYGRAVSLKSEAEKLVGRKTPVKIFKRSCFSLINISSTNECKVLYKNCLLCKRRKNFHLTLPNEKNVLESWRDTIPDNVVKKRCTFDQLSQIGFASLESTIYKIESATAEYRADERFTIHESYNSSKKNFWNAFGKFIMSEEKEAVENVGDIKFTSNTRYKIASVIFGLILSSYIIHLLYAKILSAFVIK